MKVPRLSWFVWAFILSQSVTRVAYAGPDSTSKAISAGSVRPTVSPVDKLLRKAARYGEPLVGQVYFPIDVWLEPEIVPIRVGANQLVLRVHPNVQSSVFQFEITKSYNLGYGGIGKWSASIAPNDTMEYRLPVTIAANDTSGMEIRVTADDKVGGASAYFVDNGTEVEFSLDDPRTSYDAMKGKSYSKMIGVPDSVFWAQQTHLHGYDSIGYEDEHGHLISVDSAHKIGLDQPKPILPGPGDTGTVEITTPPPQPAPTAREIIEAQRRDREELEREPLSSADNQTISVGDSLFSRRRGESKFHPAVVTQDPGAYARKIADSLKILHANDEISVVLDLSDPKDLAAARQIVDSMKAVNDSGAYQVWLKLGKAKGLRDNGLREVTGEELSVSMKRGIRLP
jgi:hypothetical protein